MLVKSFLQALPIIYENDRIPRYRLVKTYNKFCHGWFVIVNLLRVCVVLYVRVCLNEDQYKVWSLSYLILSLILFFFFLIFFNFLLSNVSDWWEFIVEMIFLEIIPMDLFGNGFQSILEHSN